MSVEYKLGQRVIGNGNSLTLGKGEIGTIIELDPSCVCPIRVRLQDGEEAWVIGRGFELIEEEAEKEVRNKGNNFGLKEGDKVVSLLEDSPFYPRGGAFFIGTDSCGDFGVLDRDGDVLGAGRIKEVNGRGSYERFSLDNFRPIEDTVEGSINMPELEWEFEVDAGVTYLKITKQSSHFYELGTCDRVEVDTPLIRRVGSMTHLTVSPTSKNLWLLGSCNEQGDKTRVDSSKVGESVHQALTQALEIVTERELVKRKEAEFKEPVKGVKYTLGTSKDAMTFLGKDSDGTYVFSEGGLAYAVAEGASSDAFINAQQVALYFRSRGRLIKEGLAEA